MQEITIRTNDLITFTEAATILKVSRPTIYNFVSKYKLHPVAIGNSRYLLRNEVEGLLNAKQA